MAVQGPLLQWVAQHRRPHPHSDPRADPHSPPLPGKGMLGLIRGVWHAHLGWCFQPDAPDLGRYVKDLRQSRLLRAVSALFPLWVVVGLLAPAAVGGLLTWSWTGAVLGLVWGGLARGFLGPHVTWSANSGSRLWGGGALHTGDESRNTLLFLVLAPRDG